MSDEGQMEFSPPPPPPEPPAQEVEVPPFDAMHAAAQVHTGAAQIATLHSQLSNMRNAVALHPSVTPDDLQNFDTWLHMIQQAYDYSGMVLGDLMERRGGE